MEKVEQLKQIVCNARYFCSDFPPSKQQSQSRCLNCGNTMNRFATCISGTSELPVICKPCYDVLKYSFGVVAPIEYDYATSRPLSPEVELAVMADERKLIANIDAFGNDSKMFAISRPRNVRKNIQYSEDDDEKSFAREENFIQQEQASH